MDKNKKQHLNELPPPAPGRVNCPGCLGENVLKACETCGMCKDCGCGCRGCDEHPGQRFPGSHFCSHCRRCKARPGGCGCHGIHSSLNSLVEERRSGKIPGSFTLNTLQRAFGLEVEMIATGGLPTSGVLGGMGYKIVGDGSVSGEGRELVTSPTRGDAFLQGVIALAAELEEREAKVDKSCGLHVHVEALDFGGYELRRLMQMYKCMENGIFHYLLSPTRGDNRYCKRYEGNVGMAFWGDLWAAKTQGDVKRVILKWLYADRVRPWSATPTYSPRTLFSSTPSRPPAPSAQPNRKPGLAGLSSVKGHKYDQSRYFALNIHSYMHRGSVEWRHSQGATDVERLLQWPLFCGWTVEIAAALRDKDVLGMVARGEGLEEIVQGEWKGLIGPLTYPQAVKDWVLGEVAKRRG